MAAELTKKPVELCLRSKTISTFVRNQNKSASDNELEASSSDAKVDNNKDNNHEQKSTSKQIKSKLAPVKSLDSDKTNKSSSKHQDDQLASAKSSSGKEQLQQQQPRPSVVLADPHQSTSGQQQQQQQQQSKQMFSLKQLAINSRNLAKKRGPLQGQARPGFLMSSGKRTGKRKELLLGLSSLSNSSSESSDACLLEESRNRSLPSSSGEDLGPNLESGSDKSELSDSERDETSYDSEEEDEEEKDDDFENEGEEEEEGGQDATQKVNKEARRKKKKRKEKKTLRKRLGSCCNCDRFVNRIDCDGQPITDVDLVTYKHLCQMEQQAHQLRKTAAASGGPGNHLRCFKSTKSKGGGTYCAFQRRQQLRPTDQLDEGHPREPQRPPPIMCRRSSLQEESGAYYELCTTPEERQIRQKYAWFPPSLKTTNLVDLFFSGFAAHKIPLVKATIATATTTTTTTTTTSTQTTQTTTTTAGAKSGAPNPSSSSSNGSSSLAGSHRDEQISFQLPRQDISLDYCSYPMNESSRANYLQFVDKRNSQALDVGTVVQVKLPYASSNSSSLAGPTAANQTGDVRHQRKASTVSQSAALMAARSGHSSGQQAAYVSQRCRRCLVCFDNQQLAVLAPNFAIGTGFYGSPSSLAATTSTTTSTVGGEFKTKLTSRRASTASGCGHSAAARDEQQQQLACNLNSLKLANELTNNKTEPASNKNIAMFHPKCFTCSTCKEFLVDLVYCLRDNKLYCLRHYGESLRPRCNWCQELTGESIGRKLTCS